LYCQGLNNAAFFAIMLGIDIQVADIVHIHTFVWDQTMVYKVASLAASVGVEEHEVFGS